MDGELESSPWPHIFQAIDGADRILRIATYLPYSFFLLSLYHVLVGSWLELFLITTFVAFEKDGALPALLYRPRNIAYAALVLIASATAISFLATYPSAKWKINWKGPATPYLIPCRTTHARQFPKKHSFAYSYLVVGIPVGLKGNVNGMLSVDDKSHGSWNFVHDLCRRGWYTVNASDYMHRGHGDDGLRGKLDSYLRSQDVDPSDFPHAYLVTAARFMGYHFNPVSFWYLYSREKILSAIVLEVNNTFDERRPYLVFRDFAQEANKLVSAAGTPDTAPSRIKGTWSKDFHVSPFNSRKGTYSVRASDPLGPGMEGFRGIDVAIHLTSSKGHAKLVARLFSDGDFVDPASMGLFAKGEFLCKWFWVGFATFPRIVKEAAALFLKRKLHVWYRPEPLKDSLGRHATGTERMLETAFRDYLKYLAEQCTKPISVRYVSSGILLKPEETFVSPSWNDMADDKRTIELKVLTPIFYSRFVHYAHDFEAMFTELSESATVWVSEPQLLPDLFLKKGSPPLQSTSMVDYLYFRSIQNLRRRPDRIPRASTSADAPAYEPTTVDIRDLRISSMDAFVLQHADQALKAKYRSTLLRIFIADSWVWGNAALLDFGILLARFGMAWVWATALKKAANDSVHV